MSTTNVRASLRRACEELEAVCEDVPIEDAEAEESLRGVATQLRHYAEDAPADPEASLHPDPDTLDTMVERLATVGADVDGETGARVERARQELLLAIAAMDDRVENRRGERPDAD